jgi:flavin reductase (DIM6/NTAB) family NADH-FMN oxidoreductase RutF
MKQITPEQINENTFSLIGKEWMLLTAGGEKFNTMTASWGGFGVLWHKNVCWVVVRPTRHTFGFMEKADIFTCSFFDSTFKKALEYCGSHSGRDVDKAKETGLVPVHEDGYTYFKQAKLVIVCKKIYYQDLDPKKFLDKGIDANYSDKDYHRMYVGEIVRVLRE